MILISLLISDLENTLQTGIIAQDIRRVFPDAVSSSGSCVLANGQKVDNMLIVDKDRIFLGKLKIDFYFYA